jgi:hypothetical protein
MHRRGIHQNNDNREKDMEFCRIWQQTAEGDVELSVRCAIVEHAVKGQRQDKDLHLAGGMAPDPCRRDGVFLDSIMRFEDGQHILMNRRQQAVRPAAGQMRGGS